MNYYKEYLIKVFYAQEVSKKGFDLEKFRLKFIIEKIRIIPKILRATRRVMRRTTKRVMRKNRKGGTGNRNASETTEKRAN